MDAQLSSELFIFLGRINDCYFRAHWELENHFFRYFWWVHRAIGSGLPRKHSWKQKIIGAVILIEWLWVFVALSEDQSSVPSTYVGELTLPVTQAPADLMSLTSIKLVFSYTYHIHTHAYMHMKLDILIFFLRAWIYPILTLGVTGGIVGLMGKPGSQPSKFWSALVHSNHSQRSLSLESSQVFLFRVCNDAHKNIFVANF